LRITVSYKIICAAVLSVINVMMQETNPIEMGSPICAPLLHPGGIPKLIDDSAMAAVEVYGNPEASVRIRVTIDATPATVGKAVALGCLVLRRALYVLVASPEETTWPSDALTDVLKAYGRVVYVGVGTIKLGSVVAIVADSEENIDDRVA